MLLGRPVNLILGAFTATLNVIVLVLAAQGIVIDGALVAAVNIAAASIIAVIANQPPTLNVGDTYRTTTPAGQPNYETTVAAPPAPSTPVIVPGGQP